MTRSRTPLFVLTLNFRYCTYYTNARAMHVNRAKKDDFQFIASANHPIFLELLLKLYFATICDSLAFQSHDQFDMKQPLLVR